MKGSQRPSSYYKLSHGYDLPEAAEPKSRNAVRHSPQPTGPVLSGCSSIREFHASSVCAHFKVTKVE